MDVLRSMTGSTKQMNYIWTAATLMPHDPDGVSALVFDITGSYPEWEDVARICELGGDIF